MPPHRSPQAELPTRPSHAGIRAQPVQPHATDVRDIARDLDDAKIAAILATGANAEQLNEAMAWASGESDVMGDLERPLEGVVARLYDILMTGEKFPENRD